MIRRKFLSSLMALPLVRLLPIAKRKTPEWQSVPVGSTVMVRKRPTFIDDRVFEQMRSRMQYAVEFNRQYVDERSRDIEFAVGSKWSVKDRVCRSHGVQRDAAMRIK